MEKVKVSFDTWVQLLGMLGVLGGLVFVGLEMQQSQRIAIAGQIQARNQMLLDNQLAFLGEEPIGRTILSRRIPHMINPEALSEDEYAIWYQIIQTRAITIQNAFQQYQLGLLPEDVWEQAIDRISVHWENCHIRPIWQTATIPSFQRYLNALPEECVSIFPED